MKIVEPSVVLEEDIDRVAILKKIEKAGRTCYKSEAKITEDSASEFVKRILKSGHESVIEHHSISFRIITDRGVTHEIVRHRLASYSQESTRYCNYGSDDIAFIKPPNMTQDQEDCWTIVMFNAEELYKRMIEKGATPQIARSVLPNSLKTEIVMTANLREWRLFLKLRTSKKAHPQIRQIANMIYNIFLDKLPEIVHDITINEQISNNG